MRAEEGPEPAPRHGHDAGHRASACRCRIRRSSRRAKPDGLLLIDDGKVRLRIVAHSERHDRHGGRGRGHDQRPQGRQPAQPGAAAVADDAQGPQGPRLRPVARRRLGGALLRAARRRHRRAQEAGGRPRRGDGQAREARRRSSISTRSSSRATASWWRAAISASRCRPRPCRPLQKRILAACRVLGRPAIVATQMLESMVALADADARRGVGRGDRGL